MESKPAPGDAGTDSGEDDDAKVAAGAANRLQATAAEEAAPANRRKAAAGSPFLLHITLRLLVACTQNPKP